MRDPRAHELILGFVDKSGGRAKMMSLCDAWRAIKPSDVPGYVRRAVRGDAGARQLFALAMLGCAIAADTAIHDTAEVAIPLCWCDHKATSHAVDDEERRECMEFNCPCQQFVMQATTEAGKEPGR
jgi:hypothetical protein